MEGEDSPSYYSGPNGAGEVSFVVSGTLFFLYAKVSFTSSGTPADVNDFTGIDVELLQNGTTAVLSFSDTVLRGGGLTALGSYAPGVGFTAGDTLKARARVQPLLMGDPISIDRIDWGIRWIS